MSEPIIYDVAIIGGGLAGLTLSISLAKKGHTVVLIEKETYPFHKVCGEYISLESWDFLVNEIGVPLPDLNVPIIKKLCISSPNGKTLNADLPLGAFGISRYTLDNLLKNIADKNGVTVLQNTKVDDVQFDDTIFTIKTTNGIFKSKVCCGTWGKRSNFDVKLKRNFITKTASRLNNYVGIKYHVNMQFDADVIALHNFKDGYCGMSKIEDDKYCVCYLTKASNLKNSGGSIEKMEAEILAQNPHLKQVFGTMQHCYDAPLSISQISFSSKNLIENNMLMIGDAAGMITPLCGNGMSMAMHGAKLASTSVSAFLNHTINRATLEKSYSNQWRKTFGTRVKTGRLVQYLFGKQWATNGLIFLLRNNKWLTKKVISLTHGKPF